MSLRVFVVVFVVVASGCLGPRGAPAREDGSCSAAAKLFDGGQFHRMRDGVDVWFKLAGMKGAPTLAFLHGGPGYNAHAFELSAGKLLEQQFQVLYLDQRGCGRSSFDGAPEQYGMAPTVEDLEELRRAIGVEKLIPMGHSFGGLVGAEYARRYPAHVAAIIQIDTTPDVGRALAHQVAFIDSVADAKFPGQAPAIHEVFRGAGEPSDKLGKMYDLIQRLPLQRELHYADPANQERMEAIDAASRLLGCTVGREVTGAYRREGYLGGPVPTVARRLDAPTLLLGGAASQVIGKDALEYAAATWGAQLVWLDAGHFIYFERPAEFAAAVGGFVRSTLAPASATVGTR